MLVQRLSANLRQQRSIVRCLGQLTRARSHLALPATRRIPPLLHRKLATYTPVAASADTSGYHEGAKLVVKCSCGSVGLEGHGPSSLNFVCHCSVCRRASGRPFLPAAGFKAENLVWINEAGVRKELPEGSKNTRFYCNSCNDYLGEDATRPLGIVALPLHRAVGEVLDTYKPNHHIFYADRVEDVSDAVPKWKTLPDGLLVKEKAAAGAESTQAKLGQAAEGEGKAGNVAHGSWDAEKGWLRKDVLPLSPTRAPEPKLYHFTESDPAPNHVSLIAPDKVAERVSRKYHPSPSAFVAPSRRKRDVIIIGGGHNGLVTAAYLAKEGLDVLVLERRHVIGGAAVTEELYPGFKFSRASYLAGLLRPQIIQDLNLHKYGFKYLPRNPSSFTPTRLDSPYGGKYLMFWDDPQKTYESIAQFSRKDAENFPKYDEFLGKVREVVSPLLDMPPPALSLSEGRLREKVQSLRSIKEVAKAAFKNRDVLIPFYELFTAPASHILDRWFESEVLKTTLATDAVIGASVSPKHAGSAYVLLHHVMGEAAGKKGVWSYIEGGMGAVSRCLSEAAKERGAEIATNATVKRILYGPGKGGKEAVRGVEMADGTKLEAEVVISNATPYHTFLELLPGLARDSGFPEASPLPSDFTHHIRFADYSCGAVKINCAVDRLPNFACFPSDPSGKPGPQHMGTIHFETRMEEIENAQREAAMGIPATRPVVEMTIPSALDSTIAPPGKHVVQFFVQFAPYDIDPKCGNWADPAFKEAFADRVFRIVEEHCPGFSSSVLYRDILSPLDLERVFGLHRGNIFHGALSLHQLFYARPAFGYSRHRTPLSGLYLCGSGAHPGGGVMGAAGKNCAGVVASDLNIFPK